MSEKNLARFTQAVDALKAVETHNGEIADLVIGIIEQIEAIPTILDKQMKVGDWMEERKPAHPEFLETLDDYENAPIGTKVESRLSPHEFEKQNFQVWSTYSAMLFTNEEMDGRPRRVIRWGKEG